MGRCLPRACEVVSLVAVVWQGRIARAAKKRQSTAWSHAVGFLVAFLLHLFAMLPDGVGRADHDERSQQKDLRRTKTVEATFREPFDKGISTDGASHRLFLLLVQQV